MCREIRFTINEKPIPQKRHRHSNNKTYNPLYKEKIYYKQLIKSYAQALYSLEEHTLCGPIQVTLSFFLPLPKTKKLRDAKGLYHTSKPDTDNLVKFMLDVMSGIIYADDAYVCKINATKYYSDVPRTEVIVKEIMQKELTEGTING